ncbi:hypothetical protein [Lentisalinibacter orientalis]|uniref:hypothetical protein n=1 Tax=Lentisalinibacter orientalis TaxID=2992241 RepID=UPI00386FFDCE
MAGIPRKQDGKRGSGGLLALLDTLEPLDEPFPDIDEDLPRAEEVDIPAQPTSTPDTGSRPRQVRSPADDGREG